MHPRGTLHLDHCIYNTLCHGQLLCAHTICVHLSHQADCLIQRSSQDTGTTVGLCSQVNIGSSKQCDLIVELNSILWCLSWLQGTHRKQSFLTVLHCHACFMNDNPHKSYSYYYCILYGYVHYCLCHKTQTLLFFNNRLSEGHWITIPFPQKTQSPCKHCGPCRVGTYASSIALYSTTPATRRAANLYTAERRGEKLTEDTSVFGTQNQ